MAVKETCYARDALGAFHAVNGRACRARSGVPTLPDSSAMAPDGTRVESSREPAVWMPLREAAFRAGWLAAVLAIGAIWMQDVAVAWVVRELSGGDPLAIALVQTATSLPVMLLVVPAGTLGDLLDRRRVLAIAVAWLSACGVLLAWASRGDSAVGVAGLLALTALAGVGKALALPTFSAAGAELAPQGELRQAVALYSVANNVARIAGPGLAGVLLYAAGASVTFALTAAANLLALALVWSVSPARFARGGALRGRYRAALAEGVAYCTRDPIYRRVVLRLATFFLCATIVHAMLPLLVDDARWLGISWGSYGAGAIVGALLFPRVARQMSTAVQLSSGVALHALMLALLPLVPGDAARAVVLLLLGSAWFSVVSGGQLQLQRRLPDALRARGMAVFTLVMMAGFAVGAVLWGTLAREVGVPAAIWAAAATNFAGLALTARLRVDSR